MKFEMSSVATIAMSHEEIRGKCWQLEEKLNTAVWANTMLMYLLRCNDERSMTICSNTSLGQNCDCHAVLPLHWRALKRILTANKPSRSVPLAVGHCSALSRSVLSAVGHCRALSRSVLSAVVHYLDLSCRLSCTAEHYLDPSSRLSCTAEHWLDLSCRLSCTAEHWLDLSFLLSCTQYKRSSWFSRFSFVLHFGELHCTALRALHCSVLACTALHCAKKM